MDERAIMQKVIERSNDVPVLVDFWAPWCQPCKQLGPLLEKKAAEADGAWELVKINVDEHQIIAAQFGIQSIPNCKLIYQGRLLGEFSGAVAENQLDQWLEQHMPEAAQQAPQPPEGATIETAREFMGAGRITEARAVLTILVQEKPDDEEARVLLAQTFIFEEPDQAAKMLADFNEDSKYHDKATKLGALVTLLETDVETLPEAASKTYFADGLAALKKADFEATLEAFFDVLIRDREYQEDGARLGFLGIFEYLGRDHAITKTWSRRFEMAIFS